MLHDNLLQWISSGEQPTIWMQIVVQLLLMVLMFVGAFLCVIFVKKVIVNGFTKMSGMTNSTIDDELLKSRLFGWFALLAGVSFVLYFVDHVFIPESKGGTLWILREIITVAAKLMVVLLLVFSLNSALNVAERVYQRFDVSREIPIKGFLQVIRIIAALVGIIFAISMLIGKSPLLLFSGLGALTAVMMLIFKDSILGLVAGIQLSANRMVARGDWIEVPKYNADGEVLEVALTTVKVQNWDKTITTLPTYALISDSFKNWRGMSLSGVRRIKRSIVLDIDSVQFATPEMIETWRTFRLLDDYLAEKEKEIGVWNQQQKVDPEHPVNARILTNIGTFRAYILAYLRAQPSISKEQTLLVRQLQSSEHGLPLEIYAFCTNNAWVSFEGVQSDLFDHLFAVLGEFGLRVFQRDMQGRSAREGE